MWDTKDEVDMSGMPDYLMGTSHLISLLVMFVCINVSCQLIILIFTLSYAVAS